MMFVGRAMMGATWGVSKKTTVAATIYEQLIGLGLGAAATVAYVGIYGSAGNKQLMWLLIVIPVGLVAFYSANLRTTEHPHPAHRRSPAA